MKRTYIGRLTAEGFESETFDLELQLVGSEFKKQARGVVPMTEALRSHILSSPTSGFFTFLSNDGETFDLTLGNQTNLQGSFISVQSSGKVPGLA